MIKSDGLLELIVVCGLILGHPLNCQRSTVNCGYSTLCLYNYNLLSSVDCKPLTN